MFQRSTARLRFLFTVVGVGAASGWGMVPWAEAATIFVDGSAPGANNGSSWSDAFVSLQDALAAAGATDEIWVAAGIYRPDEGTGQTNDDRTATFQLVNNVSIYGGFAGGETTRDQRSPTAHVTVLSGDIDKNDTTGSHGVVTDTNDINGNNSFHVVTGSGTSATAVLDGFTITAGLANGMTGPCEDICGGGIFTDNGSPTLANLVLSGNFASNAGGGMLNRNGSSPTLTAVTLSANRAGQGGGIADIGSSPSLDKVLFSGNFGQIGGGGNAGGMFNLNSSSPSIRRTIFFNNFALVNGGGMFNQNSSSPALVNVSFVGNSAGFGGGLYNIAGSNPSVVNTLFSGNMAQDGGGVLNNGANPTFTNTSFSKNTGISSGGGMRNGLGSLPTLINVILWGDSAPSGPEISNSSSTPQISFSDVQGSGGSGSGWDAALGTDGGGNIDVDPRFTDPDGADNVVGTLDDDLRLQQFSPAIDAGNNTTPGLAGIFTDLDGERRFVNDRYVSDTGLGTLPIVDMGAFEWQLPPVAGAPVVGMTGMTLAVLILLASAWLRLRSHA